MSEYTENFSFWSPGDEHFRSWSSLYHKCDFISLNQEGRWWSLCLQSYLEQTYFGLATVGLASNRGPNCYWGVQSLRSMKIHWITTFDSIIVLYRPGGEIIDIKGFAVWLVTATCLCVSLIIDRMVNDCVLLMVATMWWLGSWGWWSPKRWCIYYKKGLLGLLAGLTHCGVGLFKWVLNVQCYIWKVGLVWYKLIKGSLSEW